MQLKVNNKWHEVVDLTVVDADKSRTITTDEIEDVRTDKGKISLNELLDAHSLFGFALGTISGALTELDEDINKLDKKYKDDN
jgi:hypothetical protein